MARSSKENTRQFLQEIEVDIAGGRLVEARRKVTAIVKRRLPRSFRLQVAEYARRANLPDLAVRILNPVVRPPPRSAETASAAEKAEYAAALLRIGAHREAVHILNQADVSRCVASLLYRAYALIMEWDYEGAEPLLVRYLGASELTPYQRLIGRINYAATLVHQSLFRDADEVLKHLRAEFKTRGYHRLFVNALELSAQSALHQEKFGVADRFLDEGLSLLGGGESLDSLFLSKWKSISRAMRRATKNEGLESLRLLRNKARALSHWETVRECDLFLGAFTRDKNLLTHVYYGTPFEGYRRRLFREARGELQIPETYLWVLPLEGAALRGSKPSVLDLSASALVVGEVSHRLLSTLASDFYRPFSLASLHSSIYPDEYYHPRNGSLRVHQAIRRLRRWLRDSHHALGVFESESTYRLVAKRPVSVRLDRRAPLSGEDASIQTLRRKFPQKMFSLKEASSSLSLSSRTTLRTLTQAIETGLIARTGMASATRYRFVK